MVKAFQWYTKAAEQGYAPAQFNLGFCYQNGQGVAMDSVKAVQWYTKAAEQGHTNAQCCLGKCYQIGIGVTKDAATAIHWYTLAAEQNSAEAQYNLGNCYRIGSGVAQAAAIAVQWYTKAAEQGHAQAQSNLGVCYEYGAGVVKNTAKAVQWYTKAAEQGLTRAQFNLGMCYENGKGIQADRSKAVYWYGKAAEQGERDAQKALERLKAANSSTPAAQKKTKSLPQKETPKNPLEAMGIDIDLDLDDFPEIPNFILEDEEEIPTRLEASNLLIGSVYQTSQEQVQRAGETTVQMNVPEETLKVSREPAIQRVTKKDTAAATTAVTEEVAAAMEQPLEEYQFPELELLDSSKAARTAGVKEEMESTQAILVDDMDAFGISATLKDVARGPAVTRFEMELERGVKLSKLTNLADDIALSLGVSNVQIAPMPNKPRTVSIDVPNHRVSTVPLRSMLDSDAFRRSKSPVSFALGKNIVGECTISDLSELSHLLISGTSDSEKSICINCLLVSLLYKASPEDVRLIMVDTKQVELGIYNGIPHLLIPVVTEVKRASGALQWAVKEMTHRYTEIAEVGARKLSEYNKLAEKDPAREKMPFIVIVIDELADLMMVSKKEVEESICRIAQLGRSVEMHLVVATQRPTSDVITSLIKANIPSRISFAVDSAMESRIILDSVGAEKLAGEGDMLYRPIGANKALRVQGCIISDGEVANVVGFVKKNCGEAKYDINISCQGNVATTKTSSKSGKGKEPEVFGAPLDDCDELLPEAVDIVLELGQASVAMLQRRLKLGYARAAHLVDQMEERGYVGHFEGSKPRQLKITKEEWSLKRQALQARSRNS